MALVKRCPTSGCGHKNKPSDMMCQTCLADISGVTPDEDIDEDKAAKQLILKTSDGNEINIKDKDIVGRYAIGSEILCSYKTVSRQHAKFTAEDGRWFVEDISSSNKTYLNGVAIPKNEKVEIKHNQKLSLSKSFGVTVIFQTEK